MGDVDADAEYQATKTQTPHRQEQGDAMYSKRNGHGGPSDPALNSRFDRGSS